MEEDECNENGQRRELTEGQAEKRDEGRCATRRRKRRKRNNSKGE